ncbi:sensor histidine kinase [Halovenus rubra]|uniref:Sensor histidine kinase n=2 Tax=Halovenus rubra TaxID=869890 RepID=A0ACC7E2K9_9EURY|nr:PAS domain-containing sensor histidine kinase [Halovenus rubra]
MVPKPDEKREQTAMYEALAEESSDPLFALDCSDTIVFVNDEFADLSGYDSDELLNRPLASLVHRDARDDWERRLQILRNDETTETESWSSRLRTKNKTVVEVTWDCSILSAPEEVIVGSATDVRGGQQKEQRLKILNRALRHNIRNQMNVIISRAESLQNVEDTGYRTSAKKIAESGENIINLSNKARKAQQHLDIPPDDECAQELVDETQTVCRQFTISHPNASVETDLPNSALAVAPPSYHVALTELIENGVIHHPSGTGTVTVRIRTEADTIHVDIEDECEPIPEQIVTTMTQGTEQPLQHNDGLGLWLVCWIVEPIGGLVSFDRLDDGSGNVVTLTFDRTQR